MNTHRRITNKLNEGTYRTLCGIQDSIDRLQTRLNQMAAHLEIEDANNRWCWKTKEMGALKRAVLDFKHDVKRMKIKILKPTEIEVTQVIVEVPVRFEDEDIPYDFPLRDGDKWSAIINIDTGTIEGWPPNQSAEMYMEVCDEGTYTLLGKGGERIAQIEGNYVPHGLIPGEYGDYIHLIINEGGVIANWPKRITLGEFFVDGCV